MGLAHSRHKWSWRERYNEYAGWRTKSHSCGRLRREWGKLREKQSRGEMQVCWRRMPPHPMSSILCYRMPQDIGGGTRAYRRAWYRGCKCSGSNVADSGWASRSGLSQPKARTERDTLGRQHEQGGRDEGATCPGRGSPKESSSWETTLDISIRLATLEIPYRIGG